MRHGRECKRDILQEPFIRSRTSREQPATLPEAEMRLALALGTT